MTRDKIIKIANIGQKINRDNLIYKTGNKKKDKIYDFQRFKTIRSFGRKIYNDDLLLENVLEELVNLKDEID